MQPLQLSNLKRDSSLQKYFQTAICFGSPRDVVARQVEVPRFPKSLKLTLNCLYIFHFVFDIQKSCLLKIIIFGRDEKRPFCANEMSSNVMLLILANGSLSSPFLSSSCYAGWSETIAMALLIAL